MTARRISICDRAVPDSLAAQKHRTYGTGPKYRKIGGRVVNALDDLKAWADIGAKTSTSDPGVGTVLPAKRNAVARTAMNKPYRNS